MKVFSNVTVESQDYTRGDSRKREYWVNSKQRQKREQREQRFERCNNYDNKSPFVAGNGLPAHWVKERIPRVSSLTSENDGTSIPKALVRQSRPRVSEHVAVAAASGQGRPVRADKCNDVYVSIKVRQTYE